jgi:malate permease and related proteins
MFSATVPVFLVAGLAFVLRKRMPLDTKTLSTLNIYLFIPCLVFAGLCRREIQWGLFAQYAAGGILMTACMWVILGWVARRRGLTGGDQSAFMMTMFMNLGNFGLPICKFAFGDEGLALAVVVMVCGSFLQNSIGIYFAQRTHYGIRDAFLRVFRFPMIYAFALALIFQRLHLQTPDTVFRAVDITGEAAIPIQLMILGIQLAETHLETGVNVFLATAIRLVLAPVIAFGIARLIGLDGLAAKVYIVQMSAPVAVGMGAYGVQFDVSPRFLASMVSWTFLFSMITVTLVLYIVDKLPI